MSDRVLNTPLDLGPNFKHISIIESYSEKCENCFGFMLNKFSQKMAQRNKFQNAVFL